MIAALSDAYRRRITDDLARHVADAAYPCLGARSSLRRDGLVIRTYGPMTDETTTDDLADDLAAFASQCERLERHAPLVAFAAMFVEPAPPTEAAFESRLWGQLSALAARDATDWASDFSADADDPHFAFSFCSTPYFVIGLHPHSSRLARRSAWPLLVFNPHEQFRRLRADGLFEPLRRAIRARDERLQGDVNPNLADAGTVSEARQYSGRPTGESWRCPFHRQKP